MKGLLSAGLPRLVFGKVHILKYAFSTKKLYTENLVSHHSEEHPGAQDLSSEGIQKQENIYGYRNF